jgi:hypothetical protein
VEEIYQDLKIEIEFWRELIDQSDLSLLAPEYIRMQQALQLARRKLLDCELALTRSADNLTAH